MILEKGDYFIIIKDDVSSLSDKWMPEAWMDIPGIREAVERVDTHFSKQNARHTRENRVYKVLAVTEGAVVIECVFSAWPLERGKRESFHLAGRELMVVSPEYLAVLKNESKSTTAS